MLLHTNAIAALAAGDETLIKAIERAPCLGVSVISLGEYVYCLAQSKHQTELSGWLEAFLQLAEILYLGRGDTLPHYAEAGGN
jgi:predicted nucleic acid-binding protein